MLIMKNLKPSLKLIITSVLICSIYNSCIQSDADKPIIQHLPIKADFEEAIDGRSVHLYYLTNKQGMTAAITNFGGRLVGLWVPNKHDSLTDVVVGFNSINDYLHSTEKYFGALIGRFGNRINKGRFTLNGVEYQVPQNNGVNALHGGEKGLNDVVWNAQQVSENQLKLNYISKDMEEGFPGTLSIEVMYGLTANNELKIEYRATTDKQTVVNLTSHAFFNLNGEGSGTINNHQLQINASAYTPIDSTMIPTGEIASVDNTPFDFRKAKSIGEDIDKPVEQLNNGAGYDHNFVLNTDTTQIQLAAKVVGDKSGVVMEILSKEPGLQFYSGNFMKSENTFKSGAKDDYRTAICLETQHFPDSPNQPHFPSTELLPGDIYKSICIYRFSIEK